MTQRTIKEFTQILSAKFSLDEEGKSFLKEQLTKFAAIVKKPTNHPTSEFPSSNEIDVALIYCSSGAEPAKVLYDHFFHLGIKWSEKETLLPWDPEQAEEIEKMIASSFFVIVILSAEYLKWPGMLFAMECIITYKKAFQIVHDADNCPFVLPENAPHLNPLFEEKVLTFVKEYGKVTASQTIQNFQNKYILELSKVGHHSNSKSSLHPHALIYTFHRKKGSRICDKCNNCIGETPLECWSCVNCDFDLCDSCEESSRETIETDAFLSHKRATGQVIAGRLYEGLKQVIPKVFLDSEASFSLHDLGKIVAQTVVFIFILTEGILESSWCLHELRSAIQAKKRIVLIRDHKFRLPNPHDLPEKLNDIKKVLYEAPCYVWIAEFHKECLKELIKMNFEPPQEAIEEFVDTNAYSSQKRDELRINRGWSGTLEMFFRVARHQGVKLEDVTHLSLNYIENLPTEKGLAFADLPNLEVLTLQGCSQARPDFINIGLYCWKIHTINFRGFDCPVGEFFLAFLGQCKSLKKICARRMPRRFYEEFIRSILNRCPAVTTLEVDITLPIQVIKEAQEKFPSVTLVKTDEQIHDEITPESN